MDGHRGFLAKEIVKNCKERFNFFTNKIVAPWNTPPDYILQSDSVNIFKARLDKHLKTDLTDQAATVGLIPRLASQESLLLLLTLLLLQCLRKLYLILYKSYNKTKLTD